MARHTPQLHLDLRLPADDSPLRHRISDAVVEQIRLGKLRPGDALPSTRALAAELAVSRSSVVEAYDELAAAGYTVARPGSGTVVAEGADAAAAAGAASHVHTSGSAAAQRISPRSTPSRWDLRPGQPDTALISEADWRRAWRAAADAPVLPTTGGPDAHPELRLALAEQLRRARGVLAAPAELVIVPGVASAIRTLVSAAGLEGRAVAFEEPGYNSARRAFDSAGAVIRPVPVDEDGLDPTTLSPSDAAVYCTPAHQYPLGARLPVPRRARLIADALRTGRLLIEDDYDGEFRYDVSALPALRSIDGGRESVAYIGTASKILAPTLRLAWLLPPPALLGPVRRALEISGEDVCAVSALALAQLVESGALTRHLARAARTYAARRAALVRALQSHCPRAGLTGVEAGLHLVLRLPDGADDAALSARLAHRGILAPPLSAYRAERHGPVGLVCGYARLPETQADAVAAIIGDVLNA